MKIFWLSFTLLLCTMSAQAGQLTTPAGNRLKWQLPAGWVTPAEPPAALLAELALHLGHEAVKQGKSPTQEQLLKLAAKRMAVNELLLYHPDSGAWISFDFSPLRQGEDPPSRQSFELSAGYALESLEAEEGISALQARQQEVNLKNVPDTRRLEANFYRHARQTAFSGLIGYLPGEWFFIYATSYPDKADLRPQIETLLQSLRFNP